MKHSSCKKTFYSINTQFFRHLSILLVKCKQEKRMTKINQLPHTLPLPAIGVTVMILSFRTDMSGQTVQTQIRIRLIRVYTVCHSVCIFWTHYSMMEPHFRMIIAIFGCPNFYDLTVEYFGSCCQKRTEDNSINRYHVYEGIIEPPHEKTCLWDLRPDKTQIGLLSC